MTYAFGSAWSTDHVEGRVSRISPKRNKVVRRIRVAPAPAGFAVTATAVWVGSASSSFVTRVVEIDPATNKAVASFAVGDGPFVLHEAFGDLWVGSWRGSDVWRLRL